MRKVERSEIVDYQTYGDIRPEFRTRVLAAKHLRRIHVGPYLTFLFENALTVRYQVQEMMRIERLARENDILHELDTYNELIGDDGELGFSLLIEIDSPETRAVLLAQWIELPAHVYARTEDGSKHYATFDPRQVGTDRLSSVQYMRIDTHGQTPTAIGCDLDSYTHETQLTPEQSAALAEDLADA